MPKTSAEDTTDLVEEEVVPADAEAEVGSIETDEAEDVVDEKVGVRRKVAALRARHRLEDYFAFKDIQDQLDYLDDENKRKTELLEKVAQVERAEHPEPVVKAAPKEVKKVIAPKVDSKSIEKIAETMASITTKTKAKVEKIEKEKPVAKPKAAKITKVEKAKPVAKTAKTAKIAKAVKKVVKPVKSAKTVKVTKAKKSKRK